MTVFSFCTRFRLGKPSNLVNSGANLRLIHMNRRSKIYPVVPLNILYTRIVSLIREDQISSMFEQVRPVVCDCDVPVFEMRAGNGILTRKLLDSGVKDLHVFEKRSNCQPVLKELLSLYPGRTTLHQQTFNEIFLETNSLPLYNSPVFKQSCPVNLKRAWNDSPSLKVIASHNNGKVLIVALCHLSKNMMYHGMGRPQFIMCFPASTWRKLNENPRKLHYQEYHFAGLLFPDYYECQVLGKIVPPVHYGSGEQGTHVSKEEYVIVSLALSKTLENIADPEILEEFFFFGTQTMNGKAKHLNVIQTLEHWLPGSGRQLVLNGINCFMQFIDLNATDALKMFCVWRSLQNYKSSLFMHEYKEYLDCNKF
ncbi:Dimethyladenosine transferase 2, mitochondrial [Frankliniella fusca]|uniref:Dimethyladenosine transferase 2, mitochondrial n=1 Tax=Frankliniella fusca TaxID=407009 RepID=A0AAE1H0J0_9NEOP|nr:Dimethyladenosine transferase 2, mitochondrial [Frankliniella fusca]